MMNPLKTALRLLAAIAVLATPAAASAEYYVPPENSAATQYTESFPTAGGDRQAGKGGDKQARSTSNRSPANVVGGDSARKLNTQGTEGQAALNAITATAPEAGQGNAGSATGTGGGQGEAGNRGAPATGENGQSPAGSSGIGEVLGQATGSSSSGGIGLILPFAILATAAFALAYLWRLRNRSTS